jgi:dTDP-glucose 4,6-dehydratase
MRAVVTGGAGFLGSHLADAFINRGDSVVAFDNFSTGRPENVQHLFLFGSRFELVDDDVSERLDVSGHVDVVIHMASPASPPAYQAMALETLRVGSRGTDLALQLAKRKGARFILASTSEVYGDPDVHPQFEGYYGNVNPIGPRSCYDEAKRFAEAMTAAYSRDRGVSVGIARIFNTYGPRMAPHDGRVITNFIVQALAGRPLTIYGGTQTRSFCYVDDMVRGLVALADSGITGPVNLGNPSEFRIAALAEMVANLVDEPCLDLRFVHSPFTPDDPQRRCPDISLARHALHWAPKVTLEQGLRQTIRWFRDRPDEVRRAARQWDMSGAKRWSWGESETMNTCSN